MVALYSHYITGSAKTIDQPGVIFGLVILEWLDTLCYNEGFMGLFYAEFLQRD